MLKSDETKMEATNIVVTAFKIGDAVRILPECQKDTKGTIIFDADRMKELIVIDVLRDNTYIIAMENSKYFVKATDVTLAKNVK